MSGRESSRRPLVLFGLMIHKRGTLRATAWALLAATMLLAAACGGGGDSSDEAKDETTTTTTTSTTSTTSTTVSSVGTSAGGSFGTVSTSTTLAAADTAIDTNHVPEKIEMQVESKPAAINGTSYSNALVIRPDIYRDEPSSRLELNAGRDYKRFRGDLGIPDDQSSTTAYKVEISLDNAAAALSTEVRFGETKAIDLDITNVLRIRIVITPISTCCNTLAIGNPRFSR